MLTLDVVTGTRAEYGLLRPVLAKLFQSETITPRLLVTGSHLSSQFGNTLSEIEADGFPIAAKLDILSQPVPPGREGTARRTALALSLFLDWFSANRPDGILVLGDRYEIAAAAQAAALLDIPIAHISGGEVTKGADDDWFRHCLTKMAKLHFPSCELHRWRIIRMGEQPEMVHNVGGLGDENIRNMELLSKEELADSLNLDLSRPFALVTLHPETAASLPPLEQVNALLDGIEQNPNLFYLFTKANADAGGETFNQRVAEFCETHSNAVLFSSLGVLRYLSAMKYAALVLGNSSSGVVETPSFGTPTVNIGQRQAGRMICSNVIGCSFSPEAISQAIQTAISPAFGQRASRSRSPYNGGDTSGKILEILENAFTQHLLEGPKEFFDSEEQRTRP